MGCTHQRQVSVGLLVDNGNGADERRIDIVFSIEGDFSMFFRYLVLAVVLCFCAGAYADDHFVAACQKAAKASDGPGIGRLCGCFGKAVDKGVNQDELLAIVGSPRSDRRDKMRSASEGVKTTLRSCFREMRGRRGRRNDQ